MRHFCDKLGILNHILSYGDQGWSLATLASALLLCWRSMPPDSTVGSRCKTCSTDCYPIKIAAPPISYYYSTNEINNFRELKMRSILQWMWSTFSRVCAARGVIIAIAVRLCAFILQLSISRVIVRELDVFFYPIAALFIFITRSSQYLFPLLKQHRFKLEFWLS